jgi:AraC-like DNA-binding protein
VATDYEAEPDVVPLRNYEFRTDDLDHAVEFVTRNFGDHSRVPQGRGPLGFRILAATSGRSVSGLTSCTMPSVVRAATRAILVHLPLHVGAEYRVGRRTLRSAQDVAVLLSPGHDYTVLTPRGDTLALTVLPSLLEREIDALGVRRPGGWTLRSMQLPLMPANVGTLQDLVKRHGAAIGETQRTRRADELWRVEDQMAAWLAEQVIAADGHVPLSASNRQIVQRVDNWIRQHLSQPITLDQLCVAAGVSARTLQQACLARWGRTPLELVAARRLEAVRALLAAGAIPTVTEAAVRSGFSHLGRFANAYRRAFGEAPSDTLARATTAPVPRRKAAESAD